jgi:Lactate dehydrogenase and related dehydrogenases
VSEERSDIKNTVFLNCGKIDFDRTLDFSALTDVTHVTSYTESSQNEIIERAEGQNVIITKELPLDRNTIENFPSSVKLICEAGTGYNNIDIDAAKEQNIMVSNIPAYSSEAVAQLAIAFILNLSSSLSKQQVMIRQNNFDNFTKHLMVPHAEVKNKTLGVIGAGNIAQQVMAVARALGMNVLVNSRRQRNRIDSKILSVSLEALLKNSDMAVARALGMNIRVNSRRQRNWGDSQAQSVSLDTLLKNSDFVTIHCPLTAETRHMINRETLRLMKNTALLINTSRGAIIDEADLTEALQSGIIAGAALDVQESEPPGIENPLFYMDNVILTPHIGWKCTESRQRLINLLAQNIQAFMDGNPINVVN